MTEASDSARPALPPAQEIPTAFPGERLDPDAVRIVERLADAGFEAYLVGGCVRDLLFGLRPKDFDIATSAHPNEVRRLFRNCRIIGRRFRLAHLHFRDKIIEVATFRAGTSEPAEVDGDRLIREDNVFGSAAEDAWRRDFTWNALFYDVRRQVILDFVGGVADVERRVLRTIGDPDVRMAEDPIRILRAIRFAARMGCTIEEDAWRALVARREEILRAAAPRILEDLLRMFRGGAIAPAFEFLRESGVLAVVLPELHGYLERALAEGRFEDLEALRAALRQTDHMTHAGRALGTPVQLSVLLVGPVLEAIAAARVRDARGVAADPAPVVVELLRGLSQRIALSRKDAERVRQVLLTLDRLVTLPDRRRSPTGALVRRHYFPETLDLFEIHARATGDALEDVAAWRRRLAEAFPAGSAPAPAPREGGRPAGRPRSGGRGGRRRGGRRRG